MHNNTHLLQNIAVWLPLLTKISSIKRISFGREEDDVETYQGRNRQVPLTKLQAALSRIEELIIYTHYDYCPNSLLFAVEYFENLQTVRITINVVNAWDQTETLAFALLY